MTQKKKESKKEERQKKMNRDYDDEQNKKKTRHLLFACMTNRWVHVIVNYPFDHSIELPFQRKSMAFCWLGFA